MKVVILAGGYGSRIAEESVFKPKPMIEIGDKPILWHIMKYYSSFGLKDFIILAGYKQYVIKEYFADYFLHNSDITFDLSDNSMTVHSNKSEDWRVTVLDTGIDTMTGGRLRRAQEYIGNDSFMLTYGDGLCDVDLDALLSFHMEKRRIVTITMVNLGQQKGVLDVDEEGVISSFREKDDKDSALINGGFMVCNKQIFDYLSDDTTVLEDEPMRRLVKDGELAGYRHFGFWQCMDTQRERERLEELWKNGRAPWKKW
ncbi:MAG: glucose-1-phosphate cytidylyltransferase [Lachnospiraceae bacterium]|nr:glucose-1-phosphate cytidylyltransferase [Lachnospiraceae bacterium]